MRFWYYWEALEEAKDGRCNMELVAGSEELDKTQLARDLPSLIYPMYLNPPSSYSNKASQNRVLSTSQIGRAHV